LLLCRLRLFQTEQAALKNRNTEHAEETTYYAVTISVQCVVTDSLPRLPGIAFVAASLALSGRNTVTVISDLQLSLRASTR
jgi:hypothetical protein